MLNCKTLGKRYKSGNWNISNKKRESLEGSPSHITGDFDCFNNNLTSLVGGPQRVDSNYLCSYNHLTDLIGGPSYIPHTFDISNNRVMSLMHGPQQVGGFYNCAKNKVTDLNGCAASVLGFNCYDNDLLSLVGGPQQVRVHYMCMSNKLTDLVGCASHIGGELDCTINNITSLVGIHKIIKNCNVINFDEYKIKHGGIGLLMIENLNGISCKSSPFAIISKYLGSGAKGMMECRDELIANGWHNYAKL